MQITALLVRNIPLGVQPISLTEAITGASGVLRIILHTATTAIIIMQTGVWTAQPSQILSTIIVTDPT
jgi:hypothetical protein